jgi:hypothetical protein
MMTKVVVIMMTENDYHGGGDYDNYHYDGGDCND